MSADELESWLIPPHPMGVKPRGNSVMAEREDERRKGLGSLGALPDEVLLEVLGYFGATELRGFGAASRWCHAFSRHEPLWQRMAVERPDEKGLVSFSRSWYHTFTRSPFGPLQLSTVCSDELYAPWHARWHPCPARWTQRDNVPRVSAEQLSRDEGLAAYEKSNAPVVVRDAVAEWPAYEKWTREGLRERHGATGFTTGPCEMALEDYMRYSEETADDVPYYLFDKRFAEKAPELADDYWVPECFSGPDGDLFKLLPAGQQPAYRWLIVGPARSGSRFHQDPNGTSAWNACVRGSKKWVLFPPHVTPPGVFPSADGASVTSPLSIVEWFSGFYEAARAMPEMRECVVRGGELLFVPSRWWHVVVNLEWTVAVTHNFVSAHNLANVLHFLEHQPDSVSGVLSDCFDKQEFFALFSRALQTHRPLLLEALQSNQHAAAQKSTVCGFSAAWEDVAEDPDGDSWSLI